MSSKLKQDYLEQKMKISILFSNESKETMQSIAKIEQTEGYGQMLSLNSIKACKQHSEKSEESLNGSYVDDDD